MTWPFNKAKVEETNVPANNNPEVGNTVPEKTPAELIAESVTAAMRPLLDAQNAANARFDSLEARLPKPVATAVVADELPSVFDDENAAFNRRVGPLAQRQLETEAKIALGEVRQEYAARGFGDAWGQFDAEIKSILENSPLVDSKNNLCRGDAAYIRNVVDMVFGRAAIKAGMKFGGKERGFFTESAGGDGGNTSVGPVDDGLTEGQRKVFNRMGVPTTDAKKTLAKLKFIS